MTTAEEFQSAISEMSDAATAEKDVYRFILLNAEYNRSALVHELPSHAVARHRTPSHAVARRRTPSHAVARRRTPARPFTPSHAVARLSSIVHLPPPSLRSWTTMTRKRTRRPRPPRCPTSPTSVW